ncbi:MAG: N-acetylmuramoyl-L-alanine amidase [Gammaproteobacteria bacterium]|nr:N-acetylmuramoyl-L-alanine amidase [Gammaproteobacteria bacterium]
MNRLIAKSFLLICLFAPAGAVASVQVEELRLWAGPDSTRVVLDLSDPADHKIFTLKNPDRIVVDLMQTDLGSTRLPVGVGVVEKIRSGKRDNGLLRIVLDVNSATVKPRSVALPPNDIYGHRLVIDLFPDGQKATPPVEIVKPPQRDVLIAIDPGHGGEDPGASGRKGTREKDVVLKIARRLAKHIDAQPGMKAMLTRNSDYFLSHRKRMKRARDQRADFFLSIHADAFKDARAHGSSVYALSESAATDEAAHWLAERENAADLIGGVSLDDKDALLASVLLDLSQNAAISASLGAGDKVLKELGQISRLRRNEVQQANFLVLKSPDIPSILVETAFISNPDEERRLLDPAFQEKLAISLMRGIRQYFVENAPPDTLIAQTRTQQQQAAYEHIIGNGETLSEIAERYSVKVQDLRSANNLRSDRIRIGQVLAIPLTP